MANIDLLRDHLVAACEVHGKVFSEALLVGWAGCTKSISDKQLIDCWWSVCTHKFPKPSDLLQAVAGIEPQEDWEIIMAVAQGRLAVGLVSGIGANALKLVGGVRAIAYARTDGEGLSELERLHRRWLAGLQTSGGGLQPAPEQIWLKEPVRSVNLGPQIISYQADPTGDNRVLGLISALQKGAVPAAFAKKVCSEKIPGLPSITWLPAQRDRVLAAIAEIEGTGV